MSDSGSKNELRDDAKAKQAEFEKRKNVFDEKLSSLSESDSDQSEQDLKPVSQKKSLVSDSDNYSDDMELSRSMKKLPTSDGKKEDSIKDGSMMDEIDDEIMNGFIEESLDESKDIFGGDTQEVVNYENVETKSPTSEKADQEIKKKLDDIPSKFDAISKNLGETKEQKVQKQSSSQKLAISANKKSNLNPATATTLNKQKEKNIAKTPSQQDIANSQKAASRIRETSIAKKKAQAQVAAKVIPKKKVDVKKLQKNIKDTKVKKDQELKQSIQKMNMNKFSMPKKTPQFGQGATEKDLDQQIIDDQLVDLQFEMDTSNFGVNAIEQDQKRLLQQSKQSAKTKFKASNKSKNQSLPSKDASQVIEKDDEEILAQEENLEPHQMEDTGVAMFNRDDEEEEEGDQNFQVMNASEADQSIKSSEAAQQVIKSEQDKDEVKENENETEAEMDRTIVESVQDPKKTLQSTTIKSNVPKQKEKKPTKQEINNSKMENGFKSLANDKEQAIKEEQNKKNAEAMKKMQEKVRERKDAARVQEAKMQKLNMGPKEFLKQQKEMMKKGKGNKMIQGFVINEGIEVSDSQVNKIAKGKSVPEEAGVVFDTEELDKQIKEIIKDLGVLNDDCKVVATNIYKANIMNTKAKKGLSSVLEKRELQVVNGILQKIKKDDGLELSDVNNKMLLQQAAAEEEARKKNPLEPVVYCLAAAGYSPSDAFMLFDEDGDGALTIKEIKDGFAMQKMDRVLSDEQLKLFYDMIDANGDGVLTEDEWVEILEPKVKAQTNYQTLVGKINIQDPLVLEERILDLQYRNKRMFQELKIMRQQKGQNQPAKKQIKKMKQDIKKLEAEDQILFELEKKKDKDMEDKMRSDLFDKDKIYQESAALERSKEQLIEEYGIRLTQIQDHNNVLDAKAFTQLQYNLEVQRERDDVKNKLFREQIKFQNSQKSMIKLDRQIEQIVGRVVTNNDLETLYKMDLKDLRKINSNKDERLTDLTETLASTKIQAAARGKLERDKFKEMKTVKNENDIYLQAENKKSDDKATLNAALCIQRMWQNKKRRRAHLQELDVKFKDNQNQEIKKIQAIEKIQKKWKEFLQARKDGKSKGLFEFAGMVKVIHAQEGSTTGTILLNDKKKCFLCKENMAIRYCEHCPDQNQKFFCIDCFKKYHAKGARKKHERKRIVYKGDSFEANQSFTSDSKADANN